MKMQNTYFVEILHNHLDIHLASRNDYKNTHSYCVLHDAN